MMVKYIYLSRCITSYSIDCDVIFCRCRNIYDDIMELDIMMVKRIYPSRGITSHIVYCHAIFCLCNQW